MAVCANCGQEIGDGLSTTNQWGTYHLDERRCLVAALERADRAEDMAAQRQAALVGVAEALRLPPDTDPDELSLLVAQEWTAARAFAAMAELFQRENTEFIRQLALALGESDATAVEVNNQSLVVAAVQLLVIQYNELRTRLEAAQFVTDRLPPAGEYVEALVAAAWEPGVESAGRWRSPAYETLHVRGWRPVAAGDKEGQS